METLTRIATAAVTAAPILLAGIAFSADTRREFQRSGRMHDESSAVQTAADTFTEAPTGFDNRTNGFNQQGPAFEGIGEDNVVPLRSFNDNRFIFEEVEAHGATVGAQNT